MSSTKEPMHSATQVLVIDQAPLFEGALGSYRHALRAVEDLKAELERHEKRDVPDFERWYHSTFGAVLTRIRDTQGAVLSQEKTLIVLRKRHWNRFFADDCVHAESDGATRVFDESEGHGSYRVFEGDEETRSEARARVREAVGHDGDGDGDGGFEFAGGAYDDEQELYDDEQDYADEESGAAWFESLFNRDYRRDSRFGRGAGGERGGAGDRRGGGGGGSSAGESKAPSDEDAALPHDELVAARVKDRYRLLVKRLHPDLNPEQSDERRELWIRVQRAYGSLDLEELDLLTALSGVLTGNIDGSTSLFHLRGLAREVERIAAPLRRRVEEIRCSRAWKWKFGEPHQRANLQRNIDQELQRDLARLRARLAEIATQIARFAPKAHRRDPRARTEMAAE
jgi:hypothetical protein